ncbi:uncharacterized protein LOC128732453 [Sabethes cyaneus]|uniref:uncharacterized protein LOC128732453 n=1 Tax=Sabethes cyaneus TaxID=53552 RepID=UPI00237E83AD|nr:uncharacterized protein LOC128732453 [Sabethes cyaneus]
MSSDHRTCPMNGHQHNDLAHTNGSTSEAREEFLASFKRPDLPSRCTWTADTKEPSPHHHNELTPRPKHLQTILQAVGNTPLVKLNKIPQAAGLKCNLYAKCEFLSPGGSVKDRIGLRMIEEAERKGLLKPGCTIIEPTSGNTGIGLAMGAAVKGYKCLIVMPEKMSNEKVDTLKALGAQVIRTPTEAAFDSPEGLIAVAQRLQREIPDSVVLNQYTNAGNPLAHYDGTGAEILDQLDGNVDMVVVGAGTGGTVAGIGRKIKEVKPNCVIVGADPEGSILALPDAMNKSDVSFYEVEGVGYDFIPTVLDRSVVDRWVKFNDKAALPMARRLIAEEGFLCGGSSGGNVAVALEAAKDLVEGQNCVVILPDNIRNYLTKFVSDNWMEARNFKPSTNVHNHTWWNNPITNLNLATPLTISPSETIRKAIDIMKTNNVNQLPVIEWDCTIKGTVYLPNVMSKLLNRLVTPEDPVSRAIFKLFVKIDQTDCVGHASRILEKDPFVLIVRNEKQQSDSEKPKPVETLVGIVTQRDMLNYVVDAENLTNGALSGRTRVSNRMGLEHRQCPMNGHGHSDDKTNSAQDFNAYFVRPDLQSRCTWKLGTQEANPHPNLAPIHNPKAINNILEAIGNTPLVKLNKIPQQFGVKCNVYAKCEFLNPAGSVKDRIGLRMIEEAEKRGILKPGYTIVEPTSGNTGIGLALSAAIKGYRCVIVMPEKMSNEKVDTLQALGAEVIRTPNEAAFDSPDGLIAVAQRLQRERPKAVILNQYTNSCNPLAHYDGTGTEILEQLNNKVDMVVMGAGTGGTATGLGRKLKETNPNCKVICSDPLGSILAQPAQLNETDCKFWEVEGVGYDFVPTVLDRSVVDKWIKYNDKDALNMARKLIAEEGLLCGGSAGANTYVALMAAKELNEDQNCVVILPDNIRNHLTKFVSDNWMEARNFKESVNVHNHKWWDLPIGTTLKLVNPVTITPEVSIKEAIGIMNSHRFNQLPVIQFDGTVRGVVHLPNLVAKMVNCMVKPTDPASRAIFKQFVKVNRECTVGKVARILEKDPFVLVTEEEKIQTENETLVKREKVVGILTQRDILDFLAK